MLLGRLDSIFYIYGYQVIYELSINYLFKNDTNLEIEYSAYLEEQIEPEVEHAFVVNAFMFLWICCTLIFGGWVSDKFSYIKTMRISALFLCLVSTFMYLMIQKLTINGEIYPLIIAQFILGFGLGCFGGPMQVMMVDCLDDVVVRYCVMGAGYNLCQAIFGGTAPIFATLLAQAQLTYVGVYYAVIALIGFILLSIKSKESTKTEEKAIQSL